MAFAIQRNKKEKNASLPPKTQGKETASSNKKQCKRWAQNIQANEGRKNNYFYMESLVK